MVTEVPSAPPSNAADWFSLHPVAGVWLGAFCLWISVSLIIRLWVIHKKAALRKKFFWSVVLLIPLFGWVFYLGLFQVPDFGDVECPNENSRHPEYMGSDPF